MPTGDRQMFRSKCVEQACRIMLSRAQPGVRVERKLSLEERCAHVAQFQRDEAQGLAAFPCTAKE